MPSKPKSRTSKSKLNKKGGVPNWVIGLVILIVVGTGAFLVYSSLALNDLGGGGSYGGPRPSNPFTSPIGTLNNPFPSGTIYCYKGWCSETDNGGTAYDRSRCTRTSKSVRYICR